MKRAKILSIRSAVCFVAAFVLCAAAYRPALADEPAAKDLALKKTATASSQENDDRAAGKANDGDTDTRWCADGPGTPQWWQVDLGEASDLAGCQIHWEFDGKKYQYVVEGSADGKDWTTLSDQKATTETAQVQTLKFEAKGIRYVKITVTALDEGAWASICEVKVFGK